LEDALNITVLIAQKNVAALIDEMMHKMFLPDSLNDALYITVMIAQKYVAALIAEILQQILLP
jgi:hypothetical protein